MQADAANGAAQWRSMPIEAAAPPPAFIGSPAAALWR